MAADGKIPLDALPLSERRAINEICVEFEREWRAGDQPRIEAFAERMPGHARSILLVELIAQEIDLRIADGQLVSHEQYRERFPDALPEVDAALALISSREESDPLQAVTLVHAHAGSRLSHGPSLAAEPGSARHHRFAEIVASLMKGIQQGEQYNLEQLAREYPEHADELRLLHPGMQLLADLSSGSPMSEFGSGVAGTLGDYQLGREIGRGGMGIVYEARQISLGKRVAVKVLPFASVLDSRRLKRFLNEARAAAQLQHEHIVPVYAVGCDRGVHYYAMRLIEGNNLADVIRELRKQFAAGDGRRFSTANALQDETLPHDRAVPSAPIGKTTASGPEGTSSQILAQLSTKRPAKDKEYFAALAGLGVQAADALQHAHDMGVVHRDIKPSNIMLDMEGQLWITDFGLAQVQDATEITVTGDFVGTLRYMSPEQALAKRVVVDHRTDIYSLGVTLYELMTTQRAFDGTTRAEVLRKIAFGAPTPPRKINRDIPIPLETVILKSLARNPDDRYQTARELADDLRALRDDRPIVARPPNVAQRLEKWTRRNPAFAKLIVVTTLLLVLISSLAALAGWREFAIEQRRRSQLQQELRLSEGSRLTANARLELDSDPGLALLLALEGARRNPSRAANNALLSAIDEAHEYRTLTGHATYAGQARFSPNGHFIVSTAAYPHSQTGVQPAIVWDAQTGQLLHQFDDRTWITSAVISPDGARVLTTTNPHPPWHVNHLGQDPRANLPPCIWDALTGRKVLTLNDARLPEAHEATFSRDGLLLVTPAADNTACIWDTLSGRVLQTLQGHQGRVVFAAFSPDSRQVATIGEDQTVRVWWADSGQAINTIRWSTETEERPWSAVFSPDGRRLLTNFCHWGPHVWDIASGRRVNPGRWKGRHAIFTADGTRTITFDIGGNVAEVNDVVTGERLVALAGHLDTINAISLSPDGQTVLTASSDRTIRLWDVDTGTPLATLRGHRLAVSGATFSPDGQRVSSASLDRTVRIWNVRSGSQRFSLADDRLAFPCTWATYSPQGTHVLVLTSATPRCAIWDLATGKQLVSVAGVCGQPPVKSEVLVAGEDDTARVWDRMTGKELAALSRRGGKLRGAQLSENGEIVLLIDEDGPNYVWHWKTGRCFVLRGQQGQVYTACLSPDSKLAVTGSLNGRVSIWNTDSGSLESEFVFPGGVRATHFSSDGRQLLIVTDRNTAHLWDVATKSEVTSMSAPGAPMNDGQWNADATRVVTYHAERNDAVRVWDTRTGDLLGTLSDLPGHTKAVFAPDGHQVAVASMTSGLILWDVANQQQRVISAGPYRSVTFSADGKWLAAATSVPREDPVATAPNPHSLGRHPPTLCVWDTATWELVRTIPLPGSDTFFLEFLADGTQVLASAQSFGARILDRRQGTETGRIVGHAAPITHVTFSPDAAQVLTASRDGTASLWDLQTGQHIRTLEGHQGAVLYAAFSAECIATASADGSCILWNRQSGQPTATLAGHTDQVGFVAFDGKGERLLTLSRDRSMRLWSRAGRQLDQQTLAGDALFMGAQFQPGGTGLLVMPGSEHVHRRSADRQEEQPGFNVRFYHDLADDRFGDSFTALPHACPPITASFDPRGRRVMTVDCDGTAYIWNVATGENLLTLSRNDQAIDMAVFDPLEDRILTSNGTNLSLRDGKTGAELMTLREAHPLLTGPTSRWPVPQPYQPFSPDGRWLVTVGLRGHVRQWPVNPLDIVSDYAPRELTPDEIADFEIRGE